MTPGARDYPPGERIPGTVYQVVDRIGAGGMGTVYEVEDTTIGKRYVLKALHPQLGDREDLARRMLNEARVLARLHHPNIVEVITAGVTSDDLRLPYFVMERLTGHSLRTILAKKKALDLPYALHIAIDLLAALDHAHDMRVIHRDVKPDNIFMHRTSAGITVTKLLDFGIVSLLSAGKRETAGRFLGTLQYAAPEQLRGEDPTTAMDIYSAGLVLYELVAGHGPFDDLGDPTLIAHAHLNKVAPPLSRYAVVPPQLVALVAAALAKLPDGRPRDARSFATNLRNVKQAIQPEPRATPGGSHVLSPAPVPQPPPSGESLPRTTARGMVSPTLGPALAPPEDLQITANAGEPIDRHAATHSLAMAQPIAAPAGTEILAPPLAPGATMRVYPLPMVDDVAAIRLPSERPPALTEGAQVRTLEAGAATTTRSRAALVMTMSAMLGLAVVAVALLFVRREGAHGRAAPVPVSEPSVGAVVGTAAPPDPGPVIAIPAPTLSLPVLVEPTPVASVTPPSSVSAAAAPASPRPAPRPRSTATGKPAAPAPGLGDRPGPGF